MWARVFLLFLGVLLSICDGFDTMDIKGTVFDTAGFGLAHATVALDGGDYRTVCRADGTFMFPAMPSGVYSLEVYSPQFHFPFLKVKVVAENRTASVIEYKYPGAKRLQAEYPINIAALSRAQYKVTKPGFSLWGMIASNPMMIVMLLSLVMVGAMPMLMKNMSPEELEEIQKNSLAAGDPMQKLQQLMGGGQPKRNDDDDD